MNEKKTYLLNKVIDRFIDYRGKTPQKTDSGIPLITAKIVKNGRILPPEEYIAEKGYEEWMTRGIPRKGDVIITTEAPMGEVAQINTDEKLAFAQRLIILQVKPDYLDENYLLYALQSRVMQYRLGARMTGTTVTGIKSAELKKVKIDLPPLPVQRRIAAILSSLDDKIENNRKTCEKLEEIAQAIFKRWFVDFEFPNEDGLPYRSSGGKMVVCEELGKEIPKGWEAIQLKDIVDLHNGYSYKGEELSESDNAMITIKNFDRNGGFKIDGLKDIVILGRAKESQFVNINDVIVAHTDITQNADIIGNPIMVFSKGKYKKLIASLDTVKVVSKNIAFSNSLVYCLLKDIRFKQHALSYVTGTTVLHLSKKAIPEYIIAVPDNPDILACLNNIVQPMFSRVGLYFNESERLQQIRDALLPKLMSGELAVEEGKV